MISLSFLFQSRVTFYTPELQVEVLGRFINRRALYLSSFDWYNSLAYEIPGSYWLRSSLLFRMTYFLLLYIRSLCFPFLQLRFLLASRRDYNPFSTLEEEDAFQALGLQFYGCSFLSKFPSVVTDYWSWCWMRFYRIRVKTLIDVLFKSSLHSCCMHPQ